MARYVERAENLARLLDVNDIASRDLFGSAHWHVLVEINGDEAQFYAHHPEATRTAVLSFYAFDRNNPTSIASALHAARENARAIRHILSTEVWSALNVLYIEATNYDAEIALRTGASHYCRLVREGCQNLQGIAAGTMYRDETYTFHELGKFIERADQTTRLLDAKWPYLDEDADPDDPVTTSRLNALLRSAAAYHAYRRAHPRGLRPRRVAEFMLRAERLPRSVALAVREISKGLDELAQETGVAIEADARTASKALWESMISPDGPDAQSFRSHLDWIQRQLMHITGGLTRAYFARGF